MKRLLNFFLESNCPLCQRQTAKEFCQDCARQIQHQALPNPTQLWQGQLPVFAWGIYGSALKRAIAALKYENQPQLARPLGHWLAKSWSTFSLVEPPLSTLFASSSSPLATTRTLIVVPIPLHSSRQEQRGYNQSALLAQSFCQTTGYCLQQMGLQRIRPTTAQFGMSAEARARNLATAFDLGSGFRRNYPDRPVLLLDDIYTTGATAKSAAQTLHQSGIQVYGLVAIAISQKTGAISPSH